MPKICTYCNAIRGGNFCTHCGHPLTQDPKTIRCPQCHIEVLPTEQFCFACGHQVTHP